MGQKIITLSGAATDVLYALFFRGALLVEICHLNLAQLSFENWGLLKVAIPLQNIMRKTSSRS
ncbi:hypothetical protein [Enterobacter sp. 198]|uniref:hypothetical protein n=1 Tax=Enterobacter sp. 198 TaxID=1640346 RepID=UPI001CFFDBC9|nr:hypothetical protein [Enterobacter sp. 198]